MFNDRVLTDQALLDLLENLLPGDCQFLDRPQVVLRNVLFHLHGRRTVEALNALDA